MAAFALLGFALFKACLAQSDTSVAVVSSSDGKQLWNKPINVYRGGDASEIYAQGVFNKDGTVIVYGADHGMIYAIETSSQSYAWIFNSTRDFDQFGYFSSQMRMNADKSILFAPTTGDYGSTAELYAIDTATGKQMWEWTTPVTGEDTRASLTVAISNDAKTVFVTCNTDNTTLALDAATGAVLWTVVIEGLASSDGVLPPVIAADDSLIFITLPTTIQALDTANGHQKWIVSLGKQVDNIPLVSTHGKKLYFTASNNTDGDSDKSSSDVWAVNVADGSKVWSVTLPGHYGVTARVSEHPQGDTIYVVERYSYVRELSAVDGQQQWQLSMCDGVDGQNNIPSSLAFSADGVTAFMTCALVISIDLTSGTENWNAVAYGTRYPNCPAFSVPVLSLDGSQIFVGCGDFD